MLVGGARIVKLPRITDPRGNLTFVEPPDHVPFEIGRVYHLYDVPAGETRGGHAHRQLEQLLIAVSGSFEVVLDDGTERTSVTLNRPYEGLLVPRMVWRELENFSSGSVCLVLASHRYDEADYYREYARLRPGRSMRTAPLVPFLDLAAATAEVRAELDEAIARVLSRGWFIGGEEVDAFEAEFAAYVGTEHCVGVGNGLDALTLALRAAGISDGDEVIVPSNTFIATWLAVSQVGAVPVPVEPTADSFNIDPALVEEAITDRTRAIVPVHLYGLPADMPRLKIIARRHGLFLLEDAAQAHGAAIGGARAGTFGDAAAWSFYPGKNLGALGDAGAVTTDDADLAHQLRLLRNYGSTTKYVHEIAGVNSRLDDLQAAALRVKLHHLDEWNGRRAKVASSYLDELACDGLSLPSVPAGYESSWHLFAVRTEDRDHLCRSLSSRGIQTQIHYPVPPHQQDAYRHGAVADYTLPVAEGLAAQVLDYRSGPTSTAGRSRPCAQPSETH